VKGRKTIKPRWEEEVQVPLARGGGAARARARANVPAGETAAPLVRVYMGKEAGVEVTYISSRVETSSNNFKVHLRARESKIRYLAQKNN
jgi:hypothetical protein